MSSERPNFHRHKKLLSAREAIVPGEEGGRDVTRTIFFNA